MAFLSTLRRTSQWEPHTLVDDLLTSPLARIASLLYQLLLSLRGRPIVPPRLPASSFTSSSSHENVDVPPSTSRRRPIRIVCISDTHDMKVDDIPDGHLLVHAGDMSSVGSVAHVQAQIDWIASLPHRHKIIVSGNHDECFKPGADRAELDLRGVTYLENSAVTLEFDGGRRLKFWGSPYMEPWPKARIPMDTEVLITHHPPQSHLDLDLGDPALLAELWRVRPRLHVFGHVHWGHGREPAYFDDTQSVYESLMRRPRQGFVRDLLPHSAWLDALKLLLHGAHAVLWKLLMQGPGRGQGSLLVNAAQVYGTTGKIGRRPIVVEI